MRTMREGYVHGLEKDIDHGLRVVSHASLDTSLVGSHNICIRIYTPIDIFKRLGPWSVAFLDD